jgi:hypothetical protein
VSSPGVTRRSIFFRKSWITGSRRFTTAR